MVALFLRAESLSLKVEIMLPADGTLLALLHPPEDTIWVELVPAVQGVLLLVDFNVIEADGAAEGLLVEDWFLTVLLPNWVDEVLVASANRTAIQAAADHPHYPPTAVAVLATNFLFLGVLVENLSLWLGRGFLCLVNVSLGPFLETFLVVPGGFISGGVDFFQVGALSVAVLALI